MLGTDATDCGHELELRKLPGGHRALRRDKLDDEPFSSGHREERGGFGQVAIKHLDVGHGLHRTRPVVQAQVRQLRVGPIVRHAHATCGIYVSGLGRDRKVGKAEQVWRAPAETTVALAIMAEAAATSAYL